ncbi:hypothetical protein BGZ94_000179 [Podila epigama]|nr:hypothetical protein BGZ94_000179 [Podila epigama]
MSEKVSEIVLQTPELVFRIGWFVPLWKRGWLYPKDLVSCIKVCRLWRDVLTPLLWMVYDDSRLHIPDEAIRANRKHVRYLKLIKSYGQSFSQVCQLKGLYLEFDPLSTFEEFTLLEANPGLLSLELKQATVRPCFPAALFKPLTSLQSLRLYGGSIPLAALKSILDSNQLLVSLFLEFTSTLDPDFDGWCIYPTIKRIRFRYNPSKSTWYFRLLQSCTNLEELAVTEIRHFRCVRQPIFALLSRILQEHCRKLKVLWYFEQYTDIPDNMLTTKDYLNVIQATRNLVQLRLSLNGFSTLLCDALLHGSAHSLEVLFLDIQNASSDQESIASAGRVLSSCPKLQHLQVFFRCYPKYSDDLEKPLIAQPWICNNLRTITLTAKRCLSTICEASCECKTSEEACTIGVACDAEIQRQGWRIVDRLYNSRHIPWKLKEHRGVLLTAASALPHVNKVHLGSQHYKHVERPADEFTFDIDWT